MKKILFSLCIATCVGQMACQLQTKERDVTVAIVADLHFDILPETDQFHHVLAINRLEGNFCFPASAPKGIANDTLRKLDCVIAAGDMFDKARPEILELYRQRYEQSSGAGRMTVQYPVFPGLGNHDINPNKEDTLSTIDHRAFNLRYLDSVLGDKLAKGEILDLHTPTRNYSWNIGDVHFVQAHLFAGDTTLGNGGMKWLANDLKKYASKGNPVVFIQHYGVDKWAIKWWPESVREQLFDLLDNYNIAAFLVGHTHVPTLENYRGYPVYQVNNAWADHDGNGSFAVLRIKGDEISVSNCRWIDGDGNFEVVGPFQNEVLPRNLAL